MKKIKKVMAFMLSLCMLLNLSALETFAENSSGEGSVSGPALETGVTYQVPLIFYSNAGRLQTDGGYMIFSGGVWEILDDIALITKKDDGTYRVTLQIENYRKTDIFQVSKPGAISDEVTPDDVPMGTYNIPEKYFRTNPEKENESAEITAYLKEQGKMDESWNDKYIQSAQVQVEDGSDGVCRYSFDVDTLEGSLYVKSFYSYKNTSNAGSSSYQKNFLQGIKSGKIKFNTKQMEAAEDIPAGAYGNFGLYIGKADSRTHGGTFWNVEVEQAVNDYLDAQATAVVDETGKIAVTGGVSEGADISSLQVLTEMKNHGDSSTFPSDRRFQEYMYAYSAEEVKVSGETYLVSAYSDNCLSSDGTFTIEYSCLEEALFGRQIKITTTGGKKYYGELRLKRTPKQEIRKSDGGITLVTDSYGLSDQAEFKAELLQETTDEDSDYNKFYSLLAGNASKALIYKLSLKENGEQASLSKAVDLRVEIPDDWETDKIEVQWSGDIWEGNSFNPLEVALDASYHKEDGSIRMEGNELVIKNMGRVCDTIAVTQKADKADISEIQDGFYNVNVTMWQQEQPDRLSMSNSAVISDSARLAVSEDGAEKWIYFETQGVTIANTYGYANGISWAENQQTEEGQNPELGAFTPLEYYSYYLDENGGTKMDAYAEQYGLYYPKRVGFKLPASADRDDGAYLEFCVPVMDELQSAVPGSGDGSRVAFMTLSALQQVLEIDTPEHDASVLTVAADKASKYSEDDYTDESWKPLSDALARAQQIIDGSVTASDAEITALDKEIADSISGLVLDPQKKEAARTELTQAVADAKENYKEADYTAESFQKLAAAIAEAEKVLADEQASVSEMKGQTAGINEAVTGLVKASDPAEDELKTLVENALKEENNGVYTQNSWNSFQAAIASAQKVLTDENATDTHKEKQKELLTRAREALVLADRQSQLFEGWPQIYPGTYSAGVRLVNATTDQDSMGNPAMNQTGTVRVSPQGEMTLELDFHSLQFAGMTGYLYQLKKVDMSTVEYNQYGYPDKYQAADAQILEEYTDTYDLFNDPSSEYYDQKTQGGWYPQKLSFPIQPGDNMDYVEVYVPVMESIGEGQGTKVARLSIDWENLKQETGIERDNSALDALLAQVAGMSLEGIPEEYKNALHTAYLTAQDVRGDMNASQAEIDAQTAALQSAVDAAGTQAPVEPAPTVDKTALSQALAQAREQAAQTSVYTEESIAALNGVITEAQKVYDDVNAQQADVNEQVSALNAAIQALVEQPGDDQPEQPGDDQPEQPGDDQPEQPGDDQPEQPGDDQPEQPGDDKPAVTKPAAPSSVKAASAACNKIKITWSAVKGADGYEVYQYNSGTKKYSRVATVTKTSYTRTGLKTGTKYTYKVRAYKNADKEKLYSSYSKAASAKPALSKAAGVKAKNSKGKKAAVSWKKVSGASGYEVYRSTKKKAGFKKITTIKKNGTVKYTNKKLKKGKTYYYKIKAYRTVNGKKVYASFSNTAKVKIKK